MDWYACFEMFCAIFRQLTIIHVSTYLTLSLGLSVLSTVIAASLAICRYGTLKSKLFMDPDVSVTITTSFGFGLAPDAKYGLKIMLKIIVCDREININIQYSFYIHVIA